MSAALYAGDCLLGTLESTHEFDDPFENRFGYYRFRPCAAYEAYRELLDASDKRRKRPWALSRKELAAIDALDLRVVEEGHEVRYSFILVEGDLVMTRAGAIRHPGEKPGRG